MRKHEKMLVALMTMLMVVGMVGCGNTPAASSSEPSRSSEAAPSSEEKEIKTDEYGRVYDEKLGIYVSTNPEVEENTPTPMSEGDRVGVKPGVEEELGANYITSNANDISGLIIANISLEVQAPSTCEVISFNPVTGETKTISNFQFENGSEYSYLFAVSNGFFSGSCHFDQSYAKMAANRIVLDNFETHAGWLTADGEFFDVTEAIGMASKSDFDGPVEQTALGFTDNGLFVFYDSSDHSNIRCYNVPINNVSMNTVAEGFVAPNSAYRTDYITCARMHNVVSDWIDDTHYIMTVTGHGPATSVIYDITDATEATYIPGDSRKNWNGRISPDGTQIAFTSVPITGFEEPDIFLIPVNGGEPVRVEEHDFIMTDTDVDFDSYSLCSGESCCILIDWR